MGICSSTALRSLECYIIAYTDNRKVEELAGYLKSMEVNLSSLRSISDLCAFLGVPEAQLNYYLFKLTPEQKYKTFYLSKRSGGTRAISAPIKPIREMQKIIAESLKDTYKPRSHVTAYVKERGFRFNAAIHQRKRWVAKVDFKDFFPSIHFGRVKSIFINPPYSLPEVVCDRIAQIICHEGKLPQGGVTSPIISNIVCRGLDHQMRNLAIQFKCDYSRYCDDLVFSSNLSEFPSEIVWSDNGVFKTSAELEKIFDENGFQINTEKTRLYSKSVSQMVTGVVVNNGLTIKRSYKKELRAILHRWKHTDLKTAYSNYMAKSYQRSRWHEGLKEETFTLSILSKIMHVGHVEGPSASFKNLMRMYSDVDPNGIKFLNKILSKKPTTINLYTEGYTDRHILEKAFEVLQSSNPIGDLNLLFHQCNTPGFSGLMTCATNLSTTPQRNITIILFDRDIDRGRLEEVDSGDGYRNWGNNVYTVLLPKVANLEDKDICIETLFPLDEILVPDQEGRRFFRRSEFDRDGKHLTEDLKYTKPSTIKVLCDNGSGRVVSASDHGNRTNHLLSKKDFSLYVKNGIAPFDNLSFDNFVDVFTMFKKIKNQHVPNSH